jgi:hypothetical protein
MTSPAPPAVRRAAVLVGLQGALLLAGAAVFVVRGVAGADQSIVSGFGNAAWFAAIGSGVLAGAWALWTGRRWGRGPAVFAQLLILPVTWYLGVGSHRWPYAVPIAALAIAVLALLFSPGALRWISGQGDSASADNAGPSTR